MELLEDPPSLAPQKIQATLRLAKRSKYKTHLLSEPLPPDNCITVP